MRLSGHEPKRGSFTSRDEAQRWILSLEETIRGGEVVSFCHDWTLEKLKALYDLPFPELLFAAQEVHRPHHDPCQIQLAKLVSIKTGGCSENCRYGAQLSSYKTGVEASPLMQTDEVVAVAERAIADGASRICLGAAWRHSARSRRCATGTTGGSSSMRGVQRE